MFDRVEYICKAERPKEMSEDAGNVDDKNDNDNNPNHGNDNRPTHVRRVCCKGVWPTAPRDFVVATTSVILGNNNDSRVSSDNGDNISDNKNDSGDVLVCSRSPVDDSSLYPRINGFVRGKIHVSGYLIHPNDNQYGLDGGCTVTLVSHIDLGGNIPTSMLNMLSVSAPLKLMRAIQTIVAGDVNARG